MKRIAIVGGGISGLATAHYLRQGLQAASRSAELVLFEARGSPGGTMRTSREQGFTMEWGPNGFLTNKPHSLELARQLGLSDRLLRSADLARKRFVFSQGRMHRLAETPGAFLQSSLLSVMGRLRVLASLSSHRLCRARMSPWPILRAGAWAARRWRSSSSL